MIKHIPILLLIVVFMFALSGCKGDEPTTNDTKDTDTKSPTDTKDTEEPTKPEDSESKVEFSIPATPDVVEKAIGKPGKFKILYYHLGECFTCQEIIAKFEIIKAEFADDFEFNHFLSYELEAKGVELSDFVINEMTPPTAYLFDKNNNLIWKQPDPEFNDFTSALKKAGMKKDIVEPMLPPDYFDQPH